ncbi:MAG: Asp-tRNA(Asn)/Glu-tRNA(Gln) amidotransferase subunit GatA [Microcystaceae cyanobacterium]
MTLAQMTASELKCLLAKKEISAREVMLSVFDEFDKKESDVKAYITFRDRSELLSEADRVDDRRLKGESIGELAGLPIAVKDNICTRGLRTTCASQILKDFTPPYNATIIDSLAAADGIMIGKTNMDEFAMGSSTENSSMQVTRNPRNIDYVPGGTSGGSAAAIAADEAILAIGSDTGGSVRQPASYCGVVGMKPTYGRVSRYGLIAYASSLDQIGVVSKDVEDAALLMKVIAGYDPRDSTSVKAEVPNYLSDYQTGQKIRVGIPKEYFGEGLGEEVRQSVEKAIALLKDEGNEIVPISLPHTKYVIPAYYLITCSEASSNLARYTGVHYGLRSDSSGNVTEMMTQSRTEGFGAEVKRRIMLGTYALSAGYYDAFYKKASQVRTLIKQDFQEAFKKCDVIAHPVAPEPAFKVGEKTSDPLTMYLVDVYSTSANMTGIPAISIPCGWSKNGLPIGIQLAGNYFSETTVLNAAYKLETLLKAAKIWVR